MLKTLKKEVLYCLNKYPKTRDSDIALTNAVWYEFYNSLLNKIDGQLAVKLVDLYLLPNEDGVKRIRAKIQEQAKKGKKEYIKFLPTSIEVAKQRGWKEEEYRSFLGYSPELRAINAHENYEIPCNN